MSRQQNSIWPSWIIPVRSIRFFGLIGAFAVLAAIVASGATHSVDDAASRYFHSIQGNPSLDAAMIAITSLGDVLTLVPVAIVLSIIRRTRKVGLIFLISIVILAILIMYIKPSIGRQIPPYEFDPALQLPENFHIESDSFAPFAASFSFPSGHAARATAFAFILGYALNKKSRVAGLAIWAFPVVIGITRLYVMEHYPSDLFGGFLIGMIISLVLSNVMKLEQQFVVPKGHDSKV